MKRISKYFRESWVELQKVTWPTRKQAIKLTAAVIIFAIAFAAIIALLDTVFSNMLQKLILKV